MPYLLNRLSKKKYRCRFKDLYKDEVWTTTDGIRMKPIDMDNRHLLNCIRLIERRVEHKAQHHELHSLLSIRHDPQVKLLLPFGEFAFDLFSFKKEFGITIDNNLHNKYLKAWARSTLYMIMLQEAHRRGIYDSI
jgi:hypothetical protein